MQREGGNRETLADDGEEPIDAIAQKECAEGHPTVSHVECMGEGNLQLRAAVVHGECEHD